MCGLELGKLFTSTSASTDLLLTDCNFILHSRSVQLTNGEYHTFHNVHLLTNFTITVLKNVLKMFQKHQKHITVEPISFFLLSFFFLIRQHLLLLSWLNLNYIILVIKIQIWIENMFCLINLTAIVGGGGWIDKWISDFPIELFTLLPYMVIKNIVKTYTCCIIFKPSRMYSVNLLWWV